jgi:hypothetical protein
MVEGSGVESLLPDIGGRCRHRPGTQLRAVVAAVWRCTFWVTSSAALSHALTFTEI